MTRGQGDGKDFKIDLFFEDGRKLKEYQAVSLAATDVECARTEVWMACENRKAFRIVVRRIPPAEDEEDEAVLGWLYIDGRHSDSGGFTQNQGRWTISSIALKRDGEVATYPLTFAAIETAADDAIAEVDTEDAREVGTIKLQLVKGKLVEDDDDDWEHKVIEELGTIRKGDTKSGSMIAGGVHSKSVRRKRGGAEAVEQVDGSEPFYEFRIKYATQVILDLMLDLVAVESSLLDFDLDDTYSDSFTAANRKRARRSLSTDSDSSSLFGATQDHRAPAAAEVLRCRRLRDEAVEHARMREKELRRAERRNERDKRRKRPDTIDTTVPGRSTSVEADREHHDEADQVANGTADVLGAGDEDVGVQISEAEVEVGKGDNEEEVEEESIVYFSPPRPMGRRSARLATTELKVETPSMGTRMKLARRVGGSQLQPIVLI